MVVQRINVRKGFKLRKSLVQFLSETCFYKTKLNSLFDNEKNMQDLAYLVGILNKVNSLNTKIQGTGHNMIN